MPALNVGDSVPELNSRPARLALVEGSRLIAEVELSVLPLMLDARTQYFVGVVSEGVVNIADVAPGIGESVTPLSP